MSDIITLFYMYIVEARPTPRSVQSLQRPRATQGTPRDLLLQIENATVFTTSRTGKRCRQGCGIENVFLIIYDISSFNDFHNEWYVQFCKVDIF